MKRRLRFNWLVPVLLLIPLVFGFAPPRQSDSPVTLQLEAGYSQRFRPHQWTPLLVTVANDGPDISGWLRVRPENNPGLSPAMYSAPLDLPRQSRKQVFVYAVFQPFARQVVVDLVDADGLVVATVESPLTQAMPQDVMAAVVTDAPVGSLDVTSALLGAGVVYQHNRTIESIPPEPAALSALDVMVFSDVDTGRLSVAQQRAIGDWVRAGGHLIITGGPNYRLTGAGLADLLPLELSGSTTVDDLTPLAAYAGRTADSLQEPDVIVATGTLRPGADTLVAVDGLPVLIRQRRGGGLVDYLAVDPALAPFRNWRAHASLWDALFYVPNQQPAWGQGVQDWEAAELAVRQSPGFALPSALEMFGMLIVYIIVIGPVNYLVLRMLGRREWAWLTIPALVVIFSVLAYFTGFSLRGTQATLNRLSVVQVWPGEDRARATALVGILSPRRTTYTISAGDGLTLRPLPPSDGGGFVPVMAVTEIIEGNQFSAQDVLVDASVIAGFTAEGFVDGAPQVQGQAELVFGADGPYMRGEVTNTTGMELADAGILVSGGVQELGTLAPGAAARFDLRLTQPFSAALTLVAEEGSMRMFDGPDFTALDVMGAAYHPDRFYAPTDDVDERITRQRQTLVRALSRDIDLSGGRGDKAYLFGWAKSSPLAITLEGAVWQPEDMTLYIFELPVTRQDPAEPVTIPPALATWAPVARFGVRDSRPYNLSLNGTEQTGFRFTPLPLAAPDEVAWVEVVARRTSAGTARLEVRNWETGGWELLRAEQGMRYRITDPAAYLGPNRAVEVLITPDDVNGFVSFAEINVRWHGSF
ncbi:MAG: hypothetical protein Kow0077_21080 [Anaerolineae bacterium]